MTTRPPAAPARWVLLHGTPLTPAVWAPVAEVLRAHGPVACPKLTPSPSDPEPQRTLAEAVLAELAAGAPPDGEPDLHVVGHSFGGQVALELALAAPHRVRSLTLICTRDTPFPAFSAAAAALRTGAARNPDATLARWFRPADLTAAPAVVDYARGCLLTADPEIWAATLDAIAGYDRSTAVGRIAAPVTLLAAELDPVSTPDAMRELADRLPDARLQVAAGAAHMTPFTDVTGLAALIRLAAERAVPR